MSIARPNNSWLSRINKRLIAKWWLLLIVLLGACLRFYRINSVPNGLNPDEAALAYNAVMLKEIGKDEWGQKWPLVLKSFGDYKLPGYPTILANLFRVLPTQDWVVRLPAALAGISLIWVTFLLARQLKLSQAGSLFVALLIATQPAMIFYSRSAYEAMLALCLVLLLLLIISDRLQSKFAIALGVVIFAAACLIYNTPLILTPVIIMLIWFKPTKHPQFKTRLGLTGGIAAIAGLLWWQFQPLLAQKTGITIFSDPIFWFKYLDWRAALNPMWLPLAKFPIFLSLEALQRLVASLGPFFLVWHGGQHPWHTLEGWGHLHLSTYLLGLAGMAITLVRLFKNLMKRRGNQIAAQLFLLVGLFGSLLPAIVTVDAPHATRSLLYLVFYCLMAGVAIEWVANQLRNKRHLIIWLAVAITLTTTTAFMHKYFSFYPKYSRILQRFGLAEAAIAAYRQDPGRQVAILGEDYHYINLAWYAKIPPQVFLDTVTRYPKNIIGFEFVKDVSHFKFIHGLDERSDEKYVLFWNDQSNRWEQIL